MKDDKQFKDWYKKKIEEHSEAPPEHVWLDIQDELDIENVWDNITYELNKDSRTVLFKRASYALATAAAIILFILAYIPSAIKNDQEGTYKKNETYKALSSVEPNLLTPQNEYATSTVSPNENRLINASLEKIQASFEKRLNAGFGKFLMRDENTESTDQIYPLESKTILLAYSSEASATLKENRQEEISDQTKEQEEKTKESRIQYYLGASGQFGNSWLLSNKTLYSIRESPYSAAKPKRSNAFSIMGGMVLNNKLDLQLETQVSNSNGQVYKEYLNGDFITNQIQLNYTSVKLLGRYRFVKQKENIPVSHHLVIGTYGSYLVNAVQDIADEKENISSNYRNYDLGIILGYEADSRISKNLTLSTGARIDPGIINVYKGSEQLPAEFNKTYTSSISVQLSLKYHLE